MSPSAVRHPAASPEASPSRSAQDIADAREFAEFIASRDPLDAAAASWLVRRQDGLTPEEEAELQAWLADDPDNARALEEMEQVWGSMDELPESDVGDLKAGLASAAAPSAAPPVLPAQPSAPEGRPHSPPQPASAGRRAWHLRLNRFVPHAAAFAMVLALIGGWQLWRSQPILAESFATQRGQQRQVKLPDGSTLWLDTATQVDVALYRHRREVRLSEGQVFLAVQADPDQPFDVLAGATRVTVVGTRFSVRRTRSGVGDADSVSVVVEEGRVRVTSQSGNAQVLGAAQAVAELTAGQSVTAHASGTLAPIDSQPQAAGAWREGRINFNNTPLGQALAEFERYGNTQLVIRDPAVAALKVQGSFDLRHLNAFIRTLQQVLPVQVQTAPDGKAEIVRRQ